MIKTILASDSGPISLHTEDNGEAVEENNKVKDLKKPNFQCTSTIFIGKNMYFFKDVLEADEMLDEKANEQKEEKEVIEERKAEDGT